MWPLSDHNCLLDIYQKTRKNGKRFALDRSLISGGGLRRVPCLTFLDYIHFRRTAFIISYLFSLIVVHSVFLSPSRA